MVLTRGKETKNRELFYKYKRKTFCSKAKLSSTKLCSHVTAQNLHKKAFFNLIN